MAPSEESESTLLYCDSVYIKISKVEIVYDTVVDTLVQQILAIINNGFDVKFAVEKYNLIQSFAMIASTIKVYPSFLSALFTLTRQFVILCNCIKMLFDVAIFGDVVSIFIAHACQPR